MTWQNVMFWYTLGSDWGSGREEWTEQWAGRRLVFGGVLRRANRRAPALAGATGFSDVVGCAVLVYTWIGGVCPGLMEGLVLCAFLMHTVQLALYVRGLLSIRGHFVKMPSKRSLLVPKTLYFSLRS